MRAETRAIELGGKRIRIDADFADRTLRRQLAAAEAVDEELRSVGSGRRTGQRFQIRLQIVWIVRQRIEVRFLQNQRADVRSTHPSTAPRSDCSVT